MILCGIGMIIAALIFIGWDVFLIRAYLEKQP
jgi:hypothetical protein